MAYILPISQINHAALDEELKTLKIVSASVYRAALEIYIYGSRFSRNFKLYLIGSFAHCTQSWVLSNKLEMVSDVDLVILGEFNEIQKILGFAKSIEKQLIHDLRLSVQFKISIKKIDQKELKYEEETDMHRCCHENGILVDEYLMEKVSERNKHKFIGNRDFSLTHYHCINRSINHLLHTPNSTAYPLYELAKAIWRKTEFDSEIGTKNGIIYDIESLKEYVGEKSGSILNTDAFHEGQLLDNMKMLVESIVNTQGVSQSLLYDIKRALNNHFIKEHSHSLLTKNIIKRPNKNIHWTSKSAVPAY